MSLVTDVESVMVSAATRTMCAREPTIVSDGECGADVESVLVSAATRTMCGWLVNDDELW